METQNISASLSTMELNPSTVYQFMIVLRRVHPEVWRRVQIPGTFNFWDLHTVIQDSMGWNNAHLHKFEIGEKLIGPPDESGFFDIIPELTVKISDYFKTAGDAAYYLYDFGDGWQHDVVLETISPAIDGMQYPKCIEGEMACPPEDCGGPISYGYLKEIIINPMDPDYVERMRWLRSIDEADFKPSKFDAKLVKFDNSKQRLKWDVCY